MSKSGLRMLDVLETVVVASAPLGLLEIAGALDLDKTTTSRALAALMDRDFIARDGHSRKYTVGPRFIGLSSATTARADVLLLAQPFMLRLQGVIGETVSLNLLVGLERMCVHVLERFPPNRERRPVGVRGALHSGTAGKVILAFLRAAEQAAVLDAAAEAGKDLGRIRQQLARVTETGYLDDVGERTQTVGAVSAPLFNGSRVFGSLTVTGLVERMTEERRAEIAPQVREAAVGISDVITASHLADNHG